MKPHSIGVLLRNGLSMLGLTIFAGGLLSAVVLLAADLMQPFQNPYVNIFSYFVAPMFMFLGLSVAGLGAYLQARRIRRGEGAGGLPVLDLNNGRQLAKLALFNGGLFTFLALSAVGAYQSYHYSESVEFCGTVCHEVMKPEYVAYQTSPHAHVACVECHIGPGADWFVKAKMQGLHQVYAVMLNNFNRPIQTPIHNLRPASETCYACHWPAKFVGAIEQVHTYTLPDEKNTPWTVRMLINVGGGDSRHGPAHGIHRHVAEDTTVDYIAGDAKRMTIPWVRVNHSNGTEKIFRDRKLGTNYTDAVVAQSEIRRMDCIDCHTRPSHRYLPPEKTVDEALASGLIDRSIPWIKKNAVLEMTGTYTNGAEAADGIRHALEKQYPEGGPLVQKAIAEVQHIYSQNMFPEMNVNWRGYPDHIGHMITKGCFRCHSENMVADDGQTLAMDCRQCHSIIAQGPGTQLPKISSEGLDFEHPEDIGDEWKETPCSDCHEGVPVG